MNEKKTNIESENWKSEEARQERKERLAQAKDKDGNKKPIKEKKSIGRIVAILVAIAIVLSFLGWFAISMGVRQRYMTAFSVYYDENAKAETDETAADLTEKTEEATESGTEKTEKETEKVMQGKVIEKVSVAESNIYLGLMSQRFIQSGAFSQQGQDMLSQPSQYSADGTLRDDLLNSVESQVKTAAYLYWKAKEEGIELDEADEMSMQMLIDQYSSIAAQGKVTLNHYLSILFGPGVNESTFRNFFEKNQLGNKYYKSVLDSFTYDEATINAKYEEDPDNYNVVDYRSYLFDGINKNADEENAKPDLEKAKADADAFAEKVNDEESFKKEVNTLVVKDQDKDKEQKDEDTSLTKNARKQTLSPALAEFLFSAERKANDVEVIEDANGYRVVMFLNKYKPENIGAYDSRHILFKIEEDDPEKTDEKMKAKADEILKEFEAGDKSEESFAALAKEYSDDKASAVNGGLTENITPGKFVPEYEEYCMDPARKPGDVGIVKTTYGYHIIYFKSSVEQWYNSVEQDLRYADERDFMTELQPKLDIHRDSGIKYFGRK